MKKLLRYMFFIQFYSSIANGMTEFDPADNTSSDGFGLALDFRSSPSLSMEELHAINKQHFKLQSDHLDNVIRHGTTWSMRQSNHEHDLERFDEREKIARLKILHQEANDLSQILFGTVSNPEFVDQRLRETFPVERIGVVEINLND